jgi:phosphatidylethanolamine N-methyltransferase
MAKSGRSPSPSVKKTASISTSAQSNTEKKLQNHEEGGQLTGVTLDNRMRFKVPDTPTTLEALAKWYSLPSLTTLGFCALSLYLSLPKFPSWIIVSLAIFWRLAYDVGLGLMLYSQSKSEFLTKWVKSVQAKGTNHWLNKIVSSVIDTTMGDGHNSLQDPKLPPEYSAWILARFVINVVLPNDVWAFCLAAARFTDLEALFSFRDPVQECDWSQKICLSNYIIYPIGFALMATSLMGKVSAHHVIGQFAWFWGDFFFKVDQELTFDGIFELTPHPMYTVGYGWAYAVGLLSRSYAVLALAMGSHLCQMLFLQFVETPHIEKLYGTESSASSKTNGKTSNVFIVKNFDSFRASDVSLVISVAFMVIAVILGSWDENSPLSSDAFFVFQAIFWRSVSSLVLAYVLVRQEKDKFWTEHFVKTLHSTKEEAFENWKRLFNLLTSLQHVSFLLCAYRLFKAPPLEEMFSGFFAARVIFAILLWGLTYWSFSSSFEILGDFGWFYGDFFLDPPEFAQLTYTGIYRYINNPDVYLGHVWMYAVAILCSSWELFVVGFAAQSAHVVFLQLVEKPHLRAIYSNKVREHSTAVEGVLKRKLTTLRKQLVRKVKETVLKQQPPAVVSRFLQESGLLPEDDGEGEDNVVVEEIEVIEVSD